jgi:hypothetical protein
VLHLRVEPLIEAIGHAMWSGALGGRWISQRGFHRSQQEVQLSLSAPLVPNRAAIIGSISATGAASFIRPKSD